MKKQNRVRILVAKRLSNGIYDRFTVTVNKNDLETAKQKYKSMGYLVGKLQESEEN